MVNHFGRKAAPDNEPEKKPRKGSQPDTDISELSSIRQGSQSRSETKSERKHSKRLSQSGEDSAVLNRVAESARFSAGKTSFFLTNYFRLSICICLLICIIFIMIF